MAHLSPGSVAQFLTQAQLSWATAGRAAREEAAGFPGARFHGDGQPGGS